MSDGHGDLVGLRADLERKAGRKTSVLFAAIMLTVASCLFALVFPERNDPFGYGTVAKALNLIAAAVGWAAYYECRIARNILTLLDGIESGRGHKA